MNFEVAYKTLQIDSEASREDIDRAFRRMARRYPPEFKPERFAQVRAAYEYLTSLKRQVEEIEKGDLHGLASLLEIQGLPEPLPPMKQAPRKTSKVDWQPLTDLLPQELLIDVLRKHLKSGGAGS